MVWCWSVAGDRGLDAIHSGGRGPDWGRGDRPRLGGMRRGWSITWHSCLVWHLWRHLWRHLREWSPRQRSVSSKTPRHRKLSYPCQELWWGKVGRETRKTSSLSTRPRQGAAATQVCSRQDEGFRAWQMSCGGGEGRNVRG